MIKTITALALAIVTLTGASAALAEGKKPRAKTCENYSEATTSTGSKLGICAPTKTGGRPTYLSRYSIVTIAGESGPVTVMIGYR